VSVRTAFQWRWDASRSLAAWVLLTCAVAGGASAYEIGHASAPFTDPDRGNRSVPTEIFYPAEVAGENVPVAPAPPGGFPVVSFGHGFLIPWDDYDFLWEGLVPAGYIVALPATEEGLLPSHLEFGRDLAFVVRKIRAEGDDPGSPFYGSVSPAGAVAGHSMGGGASLLGAADDPSITAVANLAAAETNPSAVAAAAGIAAPALLFSGGNDCVTPPEDHQIPMYDALASDCRARVTLDGASHCQFAEYNFTCLLGEGACPSPTITRQEQHDLTLSLLEPWLGYVLDDDLWSWFEFRSLLDSTPGVTYALACQPSSVEEWIPGALSLSPAFPNPFSDATRVAFTLAAPADVSVRIYSMAGRLVTSLVEGTRAAGPHAIAWNGRDRTGRRVASGVYQCRLEANGSAETAALVLLR
jgi:pimeloyl-ACP methyl ester carboxylesterase